MGLSSERVAARSQDLTSLFVILGVTALLGACAVNPVTGQRELVIVSEAQEQQIGAQHYIPARQMQGGDYNVDPELVAYVRAVGARVAQVSDRQLDYEFAVLNNSVPNAWALPGGKISINRGLLVEMSTEAELAAVLGHEIVHAAARHGAKAQERGLLLQGAVLAGAIAAHDSDYQKYVVGGAMVAAQLVNQRYGREAELESDRYGMRYMAEAGYNPQGAVDLQKTFVRLSEARQQNWLAGLFASHPPSQERVAANLATAAELPSGGIIGDDAYRAATARLRRTQPAYQAYDKARKALAEGKPEAAMHLASQAIADEPEEAIFHGLKGDVEYARHRYSKAVEHYSEALRHNDQYFKYYLGRGQSYRRLARLKEAEADLRASANLLPTTDALEALGAIAEQGGRLTEAIDFYRVASDSTTPAGRSAVVRLVTLDLPKQPERYVASRLGLSQDGQVYLELGNRTAVPLREIKVTLTYRDLQGRPQQERRVHRNPIASGQSAIMMLGRQPYAGVYNTLQAVVQAAVVAE